MPITCRSRSDRSHTLSSASGMSSIFFSMPSKPAAIMTAKARYGFALGSGARYSMRADPLFFGLYRGTRTRAERFKCPQHT